MRPLERWREGLAKLGGLKVFYVALSSNQWVLSFVIMLKGTG